MVDFQNGLDEQDDDDKFLTPRYVQFRCYFFREDDSVLACRLLRLVGGFAQLCTVIGEV